MFCLTKTKIILFYNKNMFFFFYKFHFL